MADCIKALKAAGSNAQFVTLSNNASGGFVKSLGDNARGVIVAQVLPQSLNFLLVKETSDLARAKSIPDVSPAMLEGLRKFDIGGQDVSYSPENHTGLDFADLSIINSDGKFRR